MQQQSLTIRLLRLVVSFNRNHHSVQVLCAFRLKPFIPKGLIDIECRFSESPAGRWRYVWGDVPQQEPVPKPTPKPKPKQPKGKRKS